LLRIDLYSNLGDCISKCYHDISDIVAEDGLNPVLSDDVKKYQQAFLAPLLGKANMKMILNKHN